MIKSIILTFFAHSDAATFEVRNNTHFVDYTFTHLEGSACCASHVDSTPTSDFNECLSRCARNSSCTANVFQPSTGLCWIGYDNQNTSGLVTIPALDRISAISNYARIGNALLQSRFDTGHFLNWYQPGGLGVILGVGTGEFATSVLEKWDGGLYLVDPYIHIWKGYDDPSNVDDKTHQLIYESLRTQLHSRFEHKHVMVRDFSSSFANLWKEKTIPNPTFVYIDNNHSSDAVKRDIELWWNLLSPGGIMAGNMYLNDGVRGAVEEKLAGNHTVHISQNPYEEPNWFVFKSL